MKILPIVLVLITFSYPSFGQRSNFYDDFKSNRNNWLVCSNEKLRTVFSAKGYSLLNKGDQHQNVYHELPIDISADFSLEATITRDQTGDNYGFGITFAGSDPGNIYEFLIEATGYYSFYKYENYTYSSLVPWKLYGGIKPVGIPNKLKIDYRQGTLHLYINGIEVHQQKNFKPKGTLHGFSIGRKSKMTVNALMASFTSRSTPAISLDPAVLPSNYILKETFDNNYMQWDHHEGYSQIKGGHYELSNPRESYLFWEDYAMFKVHNFAVLTTLQFIDGSQSSPYGLLLGIKGHSGDYVQFDITVNGFFRLSSDSAWNKKILVGWTYSNAIRSDSANEIAASRRNDSLYFYVNKRLVLKRGNLKLPGNGVGWILSQGVRKINVHDIRILQPKQPVNSVASVEDGKRERLSDNVNSASEEFAPVISPDGSILYFTRDDNPDIGGVEKDDIWYSTYGNNAWSPAVKMASPLNNKGNCGIISVSADNQTLLLRGDYDESDAYIEELYVSHRTRAGWERPQKIVINGFENLDTEENFCLSNDKKILISSIETTATIGERDLYVSMLQPDSTWTVPVNLGSVVNTTSNDFSPFLAVDNKTLYYSSFGFPSFGKADIYVTRRLDNTWQNWSPPQNLGNLLNTDLNDEGFALAASGTEAYLSSEQNTVGKADLFKVTLPPAAQPKPVVLIYGKVYDSGTGLPIAADIVYADLTTEDEKGRIESDGQTGGYKMILPYGEHYGINASREGYMPSSENIDIEEARNYQEIQLDLYLIPIKAGQNLVLKNLFFTPGSPAIAMKSYAELRQMVAMVKQYPSMKMTIAGHTDDGNGESSRYLQKLSVRRAEAVKNYFINHGIAADRIQTAGYGKDKPLAANDSDENRRKNRRVEFIIDVL